MLAQLLRTCYTYPMNEPEDLVTRLRKRAEIRRKIPRGEPDRISDILEEAADEIERLRKPSPPIGYYDAKEFSRG